MKSACTSVFIQLIKRGTNYAVIVLITQFFPLVISCKQKTADVLRKCGRVPSVAQKVHPGPKPKYYFLRVVELIKQESKCTWGWQGS